MSDVTVLQGLVSAPTGAAATPGESAGVTLSRYKALRSAESQAFFQDAVERGRVFAVCNQAGVTSQAGLSATTPVLTLANPSGSGVNLVLWYAGAVCIVSAATAGAIFLAVGSNLTAAAVTGTLTTAHRNLKLGGGQPTVVPLLAATLPAAPVGVSILGALLTGAITTITHQEPQARWFNGSIIVPPGANVSIQTGVASGASGLLCEFIWEEVPV
jgi:hypothetical protein